MGPVSPRTGFGAFPRRRGRFRGPRTDFRPISRRRGRFREPRTDFRPISRRRGAPPMAGAPMTARRGSSPAAPAPPAAPASRRPSPLSSSRRQSAPPTAPTSPTPSGPNSWAEPPLPLWPCSLAGRIALVKFTCHTTQLQRRPQGRLPWSVSPFRLTCHAYHQQNRFSGTSLWQVNFTKASRGVLPTAGHPDTRRERLVHTHSPLAARTRARRVIFPSVELRFRPPDCPPIHKTAQGLKISGGPCAGKAQQSSVWGTIGAQGPRHKMRPCAGKPVASD